MERLMPLVAVGVVSLAALTGCGSVTQPAPAATTSAPPEVVTAPTWNNSNTDSDKGCVKKFPEDKAACLSGCVSTPKSSAPTNSGPVVEYTPPPLNKDPYKDWVILNPTDYYTSEQVSYMCSHADTAFYRIGTGPYGMPVAKSSDCANDR